MRTRVMGNMLLTQPRSAQKESILLFKSYKLEYYKNESVCFLCREMHEKTKE